MYLMRDGAVWQLRCYMLTYLCRMQDLGKLGFKYQFVTLAGFHSLNHGMFTLSAGYAKRGMAAYSELQQAEFASEKLGYTATKCVAPSQRATGCYRFVTQFGVMVGARTWLAPLELLRSRRDPFVRCVGSLVTLAAL